MEKEIEEKGLTKISNGIFAKIRRLLINIFNKKHIEIEENKVIISIVEKVENIDDKNHELENKSNEFTVKIKENKFVIESELPINLEKNESKDKKEQDDNYEQKEEIEQKLKNYYASIKKAL